MEELIDASIHFLSERDLRIEAIAEVENLSNMIDGYKKRDDAGKIANSDNYFGAYVLHEIVTPLTILPFVADKIDVMIKLLLSEEEAAKFNPLIGNLNSSISRLNEIVSAMRSIFADRSDHPLIKSWVKLENLFANVKKFVEPNIGEATLLFGNFDKNLGIDCSEVLICRILENLIENAADAVRDCQRKEILVEAFETENKLEISVSDTGKGISKFAQKEIFSPFFSLKKEGTGIGLFLSRKIAVDHGGTLSVDINSQLTRFVLQLPKK